MLILLLLALPACACMEMATMSKLMSVLIPKEEPVPEAVVLYDGVGPFGTGECVEVLETKEARHRVRRKGGEEAWVDDASVYVFPGTRYYEHFLLGGSIVLDEAPLEVATPSGVLHSAGFAARAARSKIPAVRTYGLLRQISLAPRAAAAAAWLELRRHAVSVIRERADAALAKRSELTSDEGVFSALERELATRPLGELDGLIKAAAGGRHPRAGAVPKTVLARCVKEFSARMSWRERDVCRGVLGRDALAGPNADLRRLALDAHFGGPISAEDAAVLEARLDDEPDMALREAVLLVLIRRWHDGAFRIRLTARAADRAWPRELRQLVRLQLRHLDDRSAEERGKELAALFAAEGDPMRAELLDDSCRFPDSLKLAFWDAVGRLAADRCHKHSRKPKSDRLRPITTADLVPKL